MNKCLAYWHAVTGNYRDTLAHHQHAAPPLPWASIYLLLGLGAAFALTAALAFYLGGHHLGFGPINQLGAHLPEFLLHNLTVFGDGIFICALVLLFANRQVQFQWTVLVAALIGGLASNLLKDYFNADRPAAALLDGSFHLVGKAYYHRSFPSGHTITAFLFAGVLLAYLRRWYWKACALTGAGLVGLSRVWVGAHWPVDVLGGAAVGCCSAAAASYISFRWRGGLKAPLHLFTLTLLLVASVHALLYKNDYRLALAMIYLSALAALWQTLSNYLLPARQQPWPAQLGGKPERTYWVILALLTLYRIAVLGQDHLLPFYDETYYYHWALNPDFGYYSKPPMVAWAIGLSTALFGSSTVAIKLMAALLYGGAATLIFYTIKQLADSHRALLGGLIFLTIPLIGFNSEFITTDAPLIFFWTLSLFFFFRALASARLAHWLGLGLATGAGMLSKYTMGALPLALFLFLLFSPAHRALLRSYQPWLAALIAGLIFSLNIYWNAEHGWVALHHTQEISQTDGPLLNLPSLLGFLASQIFVFGPVWTALLLGLYWRRQNTLARETQRALLFATLVILVAISLQAFFARAFANWAGPWVVGATLLLALQLDWRSAGVRRWFARGLVAHLALLSAFYHWPQLLSALDVPLSRKNDPYHRVLGWPELGRQLRPLLSAQADTVLASDSRDLLAYLGYYAAPGSFALARWNPDPNNVRDYYDLKANLREYAGKADQTFIFVSRAPLDSALLQRFHSAEFLTRLTAQVYDDYSLSVEVYRVSGFIGYHE